MGKEPWAADFPRMVMGRGQRQRTLNWLQVWGYWSLRPSSLASTQASLPLLLLQGSAERKAITWNPHVMTFLHLFRSMKGKLEVVTVVQGWREATGSEPSVSWPSEFSKKTKCLSYLIPGIGLIISFFPTSQGVELLKWDLHIKTPCKTLLNMNYFHSFNLSRWHINPFLQINI